ncbi:MAG: AAA family ATPase [Tissierellia bacterium]|mgnify:CR=1 FL=1|jgi:predicted ATP-dependent endonuclease of OLD family|nr:AAA family ATPase [Tissierellia bacterium]
MKIKKITIHNFRSILHQSIDCKDFTLFVGENNSGKTNLISVLRTFYEVDGYKYNDKTDFPKLSAIMDNDSWIQIEFSTTDEEQSTLKDEYQREDKILTVRRYFKSEEHFDKDNSNIFFIDKEGQLSENNFYGAKNISQAKLGKVIYIPEVAKTDDTFKLSGPSPLRQVITFVFKKVLEKSEPFSKLSKSFEKFNTDFKTEESEDGISMENLKNDINEELRTWQFSFGFDINPIKSDIIIKNLVEHFLEDDNLQIGKKRVDMNNIGQGLQRHLIYTMIKLAAKYDEKKSSLKKEFLPDFTLILFEEPEAFLHPSQQELMNLGLKQIAKEENQQVFCTSHSSVFVSKNIKDMSELKRIEKDSGESILYQVDNVSLATIYSDNIEFNNFLLKQIKSGIPEADEKELNKLINDKDDEIILAEEAIKFSIWLDTERSSMFFAKHILICEGASEKAFIDYLMNTEWIDLKERHIYCLDALGKYNIHRYISLLSKFGLSYSVLMDFDEDKKQHKYINQFIKDKAVKVYGFDKDFESFLGVTPVPSNRNDLKPLNVLKNNEDGLIAQEKIDELKTIILGLID